MWKCLSISMRQILPPWLNSNYQPAIAVYRIGKSCPQSVLWAGMSQTQHEKELQNQTQFLRGLFSLMKMKCPSPV